MKTEKESQFTFEDLVLLDKELAQSSLTKDVSAEIAALSLPSIPQLCPLYKKIKPVISIILVLPFIPANVKAAVKSLLAILDTLCP